LSEGAAASILSCAAPGRRGAGPARPEAGGDVWVPDGGPGSRVKRDRRSWRWRLWLGSKGTTTGPRVSGVVLPPGSRLRLDRLGEGLRHV